MHIPALIPSKFFLLIFGSSSRICTGSIRVNTEPTPGSLSAVMAPPMRDAIFLVRVSPSPAPSMVRSLPESTCSKLWNILSRFSFSIPIPVSLTLMIIMGEAALSTLILMYTPPSGVYLMAFVTRFIATWNILAMSPNSRPGMSSSTSTKISIFFSCFLAIAALTISLTRTEGSKSFFEIVRSPASILDTSRISLITYRRFLPAPCIS